MSLSKDKGHRHKESKPEEVPIAAPQAAAPGEAVDLESQLAAKQKEVAEYHDRLLRLAAEMENLKKRQEKERAELLRFANESLIKELLPVVDHLELAMEHGRQQDTSPSFLEGLELVHQGFLKALGRFGVTPLDSVGQNFDPVYHHAVMEAADPDAQEGQVIKEMQKGYLYHQRLLRPAMVVVASNSPKTSSQTD